MKLTEIINRDKPNLSFEVFPPKTEDTFESIRSATEEIAALHPGYMSVTYGAGGSGKRSAYSVAVAANIKDKFGVEPLAHLTCISSTREQVHSVLDDMKAHGIENILALRGDIPEGMTMDHLDYHYAAELVREIKEAGDFCIGGACYPESHPDSPTSFDDIKYLREKVDSGCDFLTTQMFFDNNVMYNFLYRAREAGISVPIIAGIMPVTNPKTIKRTCAICGAALPQRFIRIVDRFGSDPVAMKQAGIAYATEQIIDLFANGVNAVHVYCMNKPDVAKAIMDNISLIIG